MKKHFQKYFQARKGHSGFTLIELLVVIAIIAILSAIILVALNSARSKAINARAESEMSDLGAQLELYYDGVGSGTYGVANTPGDCAAEPFALGSTSPQTDDAFNLITGIHKDVGSMNCYVEPQDWAVGVTFNDGSTWCSDSNGDSKPNSTPTTSAPFVCQ